MWPSLCLACFSVVATIVYVIVGALKCGLFKFANRCILYFVYVLCIFCVYMLRFPPHLDVLDRLDEKWLMFRFWLLDFLVSSESCFLNCDHTLADYSRHNVHIVKKSNTEIQFENQLY